MIEWPHKTDVAAGQGRYSRETTMPHNNSHNNTKQQLLGKMGRGGRVPDLSVEKTSGRNGAGIKSPRANPRLGNRVGKQSSLLI